MKQLLLCLLAWCGPVLTNAENTVIRGQWPSDTAATNLEYTLLKPADPMGQPQALVIYLKNLAAERIGQESDASIIADLLKAGDWVMVLDYAKSPSAKIPGLSADTFKLRTELFGKKLLTECVIDLNHVFILAEGCRLKRDETFYQDGNRTLGMDIIYPSRPKRPVGTVVEFSCDNKDRMGMYSLVFCSDTIIDTAGAAGLAVAMADHPVAAPYKGFDPLPDGGYKLQAAVRTLRSQPASLGLNGKIGVVGFSRGSGMALLLAETGGSAEFAGHGLHPGADASVQAAVIMSGRFDYLDLLSTDKMIPRYEKMWGARKDHENIWRQQSALSYLTTHLPPLFLTINSSEFDDAQHHMAVLRQHLDELHLKYQFQPEPEPRGHKIPLNQPLLAKMWGYLNQQLNQ